MHAKEVARALIRAEASRIAQRSLTLFLFTRFVIGTMEHINIPHGTVPGNPAADDNVLTMQDARSNKKPAPKEQAGTHDGSERLQLLRKEFTEKLKGLCMSPICCGFACVNDYRFAYVRRWGET